VLRIGLFEPGSKTPTWMHGKAFWPTVEDRRDLIKTLKDWSKLDFGDAWIGIFPDDAAPAI
jgi:hypothetical protein